MDFEGGVAILLYFVPAILTGAFAYYFFSQFIKNEEGKRRFQLMKDNQKQLTLTRLQAYERMTLFLERINPVKLLVRIKPISTDKNDYENLLISTIEQEFDHNVTQQIYVTDECWAVIKTAKNATIKLIRKAGMQEKTLTADKLREAILTETLEQEPPSNAALSYIKKEVAEMS
jgi:hypothetical protein